MDLIYLTLCLAILIATAIARNRNGLLYLVALTSWVISEITTNIFPTPWSSAGYVLFYPLIFVALPSLFEIEQAGQLIRLLDGSVLVLGTSAILSAIFLRNFKSDFLHLLYPVCDIIILIPL